ncbi:MAG: SWIM zinc finger domain-containing protein [Candidatus Izemoplasmatales bacterium]
MKLGNFENEFEDRILSRGREYFQSGRITDLNKVGNRYSAIAHGTEKYQVEVVVDEDDEILDANCGCPYDFGNHCKHQVALFYAIRQIETAQQQDEQTRTSEPAKKPIEHLIRHLSKAEMETLLVTFANRFEEVEDQIRFRLGTDQEKMKAAKEIIKFHLRNARHRGFIEASDAYSAFSGARIVFQEALSCDSLVTGIALCVLGIESVHSVDAIDDSNGIIMEMYDYGKESIEQLLSERLVDATKQVQKTVFSQMMKMMNKLWQEDLSYTGGELIETLLPFCTTPDFAKEYRNFLVGLKTRIVNQSSSSRIYGLNSIEMLELHLYDIEDDAIGRTKFIEEHLGNSEIREIAIHETITDNRFDDALELISAGIVADERFPGLVNKCNHLAFQVHQSLQNPVEIRILSEKFLLQNEISFYDTYLETYSQSEHDSAADAILSKLEEKNSINDTYIGILIREKRLEKLMLLCELRSFRIKTLYPYLIDGFRERVQASFQRHIRENAALATDRRGYRRVCSIIRKYRDAFPHEYQDLVQKLISVYSRRPAMVDELKKPPLPRY